MTEVYRIFGSELSPYSVKVRSYFRYKAIPHRWISRSRSNADEFSRFAKLPIIPLVVTPDGSSLQDSTPIIEAIEAESPLPALQPDDALLGFLDALLEEFADEWANKWMFHYRWRREVDQVSAAGRIALSMEPNADEAAQAELSLSIQKRMTDRLWFVGSNAHNEPFIENAFKDALSLLNEHLEHRDFLFGGRPASADFAMFGQLYEMWSDPTPGAIIISRAPHVLDWLQRMLWPKASGKVEDWESLKSTLAPFLKRHVGGHFLPWTIANAKAIKSGTDSFGVVLDGHHWTQIPQKYHAKSLQSLRSKYDAISEREGINAVLRANDCLSGFE